MPTVESALRAAGVRAIAAAILVAPALAIPFAVSTQPALAAPCSQASTNGSVALQCGPPPVGGAPDYTGNCTNAYGTYQNCIVQQFPPRDRPNR